MSRNPGLLPPLAFLDRTLEAVDPEVARWIREEERRQNGNLELIASENWVSQAVRQAQGSVLTNKYAEGYPGRRYYGGCEVVDEIEQLAIDRAKELFGAEHANVQPHAGAQANMRGIGTSSRALLIGIPLVAVTIADEGVGLAAAIVYALASIFAEHIGGVPAAAPTDSTAKVTA